MGMMNHNCAPLLTFTKFQEWRGKVKYKIYVHGCELWKIAINCYGEEAPPKQL